MHFFQIKATIKTTVTPELSIPEVCAWIFCKCCISTDKKETHKSGKYDKILINEWKNETLFDNIWIRINTSANSKIFINIVYISPWASFEHGNNYYEHIQGDHIYDSFNFNFCFKVKWRIGYFLLKKHSVLKIVCSVMNE